MRVLDLAMIKSRSKLTAVNVLVLTFRAWSGSWRKNFDPHTSDIEIQQQRQRQLLEAAHQASLRADAFHFGVRRISHSNGRQLKFAPRFPDCQVAASNSV